MPLSAWGAEGCDEAGLAWGVKGVEAAIRGIRAYYDVCHKKSCH